MDDMFVGGNTDNIEGLAQLMLEHCAGLCKGSCACVPPVTESGMFYCFTYQAMKLAMARPAEPRRIHHWYAEPERPL